MFVKILLLSRRRIISPTSGLERVPDRSGRSSSPRVKLIDYVVFQSGDLKFYLNFIKLPLVYLINRLGEFNLIQDFEVEIRGVGK